MIYAGAGMMHGQAGMMYGRLGTMYGMGRNDVRQRAGMKYAVGPE